MGFLLPNVTPPTSRGGKRCAVFSVPRDVAGYDKAPPRHEVELECRAGGWMITHPQWLAYDIHSRRGGRPIPSWDGVLSEMDGALRRWWRRTSGTHQGS